MSFCAIWLGVTAPITGATTKHPHVKTDEGPQHLVTVIIRIAMGRTEVTYDEWMACVNDGGCNRCDGSEFDRRFVWAVTGETPENGTVKVADRQKLRLGTRVITEAGNTIVLGDILQQLGAVVMEGGMVKASVEAEEMPFHWRFSAGLPKPEDYILQRSQLTLEEIYSAAEWEAVPPQIPVPFKGEAGPSFMDMADGITDGTPPNTPLEMAAKHFPAMNRKQRKAAQARMREKGGGVNLVIPVLQLPTTIGGVN